MKYKVGDKVTIVGTAHEVIVLLIDGSTTLIRRSNGKREWVSSDRIHPDYRALYEQEKTLREAAEAVLESYANGIVNNLPDENYDQALKHYQQLKQQYNG